MITSRHNPLIRHARAVARGASKETLFIEGLRLCEEASRAGLRFEEVLHTEKFAAAPRAAALLLELEKISPRLTVVNEQVFSHLGETKTSQGIVALARRPPANRQTFTRAIIPHTLVVILHRLNNPANAGALLRVAEAAGATGIIATSGSADLLSPKALRGAMGSSFRLPLWTNATYADALDWCREQGIRTVGTDLAAERSHIEINWTPPRAVVMGGEADGLSRTEARATDEHIRIPMRPPVESLNVAVALAVVLYEAARQRAFAVQP